MASSIMSCDRFKYTNYQGSSQQVENCFLNQPVLYKPCRNNSSNGNVKNGHDSLMTGTGNTADSQSPPYHCGNGVI